MSQESGQPDEGWYLIVNGSPEHQRILDALGLEGVEMVQHNGDWLLFLEDIQEGFLEGDPKDRLEAGRQVLASINGLSELGAPLPDSLEASGVADMDDAGRMEAFTFATEQAPVTDRVSVTVTDADGESEEFDHIDLTTPEKRHGLATPRRRRALRLLSGDPGFRELYVVLEDAIEELGGSSGVEKSGISWQEVERFKQTANSHQAIGDDARHGESKKVRPPDNPMELNEAQRMVTRLVNHWTEKDPAVRGYDRRSEEDGFGLSICHRLALEGFG